MFNILLTFLTIYLFIKVKYHKTYLYVFIFLEKSENILDLLKSLSVNIKKSGNKAYLKKTTDSKVVP